MYFIGWNEISHHIIVAWNLFQGVIFQEVKVMTQILLVEDDGALAMGIEFTLKEEGYKIYIADTLQKGKELYQQQSFDLIVLDINLPDGSGYELCRHIRTTSDVPIIFLTALDEEVNVVLGLDIGGDDYITKPFRVRELLSRIKALLRRTAPNSKTDTILKSGHLIVNTSTAQVTKNQEEINLTALEYKLLLTFLHNSKKVLQREQILGLIIDGEESFFDENTLSVYIKRLREKIEDNPKQPQYILTKRGLGYMWQREVTKE